MRVPFPSFISYFITSNEHSHALPGARITNELDESMKEKQKWPHDISNAVSTTYKTAALFKKFEMVLTSNAKL